MAVSTIKLNENLIRLAKGMIKAWEEWIQAKKLEEKNNQVRI